ncbi:hypothetical protein GW17_00026618 [Ensete ventricosum]|nr:hypothetical protein GW17_00026618 [Ensete ventricosum]
MYQLPTHNDHLHPSAVSGWKKTPQSARRKQKELRTCNWPCMVTVLDSSSSGLSWRGRTKMRQLRKTVAKLLKMKLTVPEMRLEMCRGQAPKLLQVPVVIEVSKVLE